VHNEPKTAFNLFWVDCVLRHFPKAKIRYKNTSLFMRILGKLMFFNKSFMTNYITTIGKTIYFPSNKWLEANYDSALVVAMHEFIHIWDSEESWQKNKLPTFAITYLAPQILGIFSLASFLAFVDMRFLFALVFVVFLFPWPSPWRTKWEVNGYAMNMVYHSFCQGAGYNAREGAEIAAEQFTSSNYYWMSRDKDAVINQLLETHANGPQTHGGMKAVHSWLNKYQCSRKVQ
jgi:hypothetical protein